MALNPPVVAQMVEQTKSLLDLWMRVRLIFIKSFSTQPIGDDQEKAYLDLKGEIQRLYRVISEELTPGLNFEGDKMMDTLKNAISMEQMRTQSASERQKYFAIWHQIYIRITRTLGALEIIHAGYYPHEHRALIKGASK